MRPGPYATVALFACALAYADVGVSVMFLVLASPLVMGLGYAIGPFDANPWYEAYSGDLTAVAGLCLLVAAVVPSHAGQSPAEGARPPPVTSGPRTPR